MTEFIVSFLSAYYTYRKPSGGKIERLISKEGWTSNCPKAQDILDMWTPALKYVIESDKNILSSCSRQKWKGLAIKSFDGQKGEGKTIEEIVSLKLTL